MQDKPKAHTDPSAPATDTHQVGKLISKGSLLSKVAKFGIPLAVSVALCFILFRDIDLQQMWHIISEECNFWYVGAAMLIGLIPVAVRAARWGIQLRAINVRPPFRILFYSIFGTYSFNLVFPRLGEVWRSGYIAYRQKAPFPAIFGSMIADRLADTVVVALLTLFTFLFASEPFIRFMRENADSAMFDSVAALLASPFLWAGVVTVAAVVWFWIRKGKGRLPQAIRRFIRGLWEGFAAIARMNGKGRWLLLTGALWLCYFLQMYITFHAFPFTREILNANGLEVVIICYMLSTVAMAIPSNGGIGPYQTAVVFGLKLFAPSALAMAGDAAQKEFLTAGAAFANTLLGAQTLVWIVGGIVIFILIAADRKKQNA